MRFLLLILILCVVPINALASQDNPIAIMERRLAEIGEPQNALQRIEKKRLEESLAERKLAVSVANKKKQEEELAQKREAELKKAEELRLESLTPEQRAKESQQKMQVEQQALLVRQAQVPKSKLLDTRRQINQVFAEGQRLVEKTQCVEAYVRKYQIGKLNDFHFRNLIATCQKFIQNGAAQVNCQTCAGTFVYGNSQYQSVAGGQIVRATLTADDGMVFDMTQTRLRASWPQSGYYIVYDLSDGQRVRVAEINSHITENIVRSYLRPTDKLSYNTNVFFRKIDELLSKTQIPVEEFSRLVFEADWLEMRLKELGGI